VGRYLAGLGSAGDLDLRGMIEALFAKPMTAEKITEEWNRRNGDVAPVKTEELINFLKEAGYTDDDLAQNEGKFEAKDWAGMLKKAAKYSDTFRGLIASTKGENKGREARKTDDQFIDGFIDSLTD
jgi:hypothetical protein